MVRSGLRSAAGMADQYTVVIPEIIAASFSINPININSNTMLSVSVAEKTVILEPVKFYSGEIFAGEV